MKSMTILAGVLATTFAAVAAPTPDQCRSTTAMCCGNGSEAAAPDASTAIAPIDSATLAEAPQATREALEAAAYFDKLVERYRKLNLYKDTARVVQITKRDGEEAHRVETQINCEIVDGELRVTTPASQLRADLGLDIPFNSSKTKIDARRAFDLWLAPHMAMKYTRKPIKELRAGVDSGFTATEVEKVTIDNKTMMHLELKSGDGLSQDCDAHFDLYVNTDSMLIECIKGEQRLPDGASYSTTLHIQPQETLSAGESATAEPAESPAAAAEKPSRPPAGQPSA